jgi:hypothetical protein
MVLWRSDGEEPFGVSVGLKNVFWNYHESYTEVFCGN